MRVWISVLASVWFGACASPHPATSVLVEVDSDLLVGAELTELHVQVFDRDGVSEWGTRIITLATEPGPAQFELPASFAFTPGADDVREFRLVVTGRGPLGGGLVRDLVERQAIVAFRSQEEVRLPIELARSCLEQLCRSPDGLRTDLTCSSGQCVDAQQVTRKDNAGAPPGEPPTVESIELGHDDIRPASL